jgi:hypothetical protein
MDRRLLQGILVWIVVRLLAPRVVGRLARIAVAAGVEGIDGGVGIGVRHGITSGWEGEQGLGRTLGHARFYVEPPHEPQDPLSARHPPRPTNESRRIRGRGPLAPRSEALRDRQAELGIGGQAGLCSPYGVPVSVGAARPISLWRGACRGRGGLGKCPTGSSSSITLPSSPMGPWKLAGGLMKTLPGAPLSGYPAGSLPCFCRLPRSPGRRKRNLGVCYRAGRSTRGGRGRGENRGGRRWYGSLDSARRHLRAGATIPHNLPRNNSGFCPKGATACRSYAGGIGMGRGGRLVVSSGTFYPKGVTR